MTLQNKKRSMSHATPAAPVTEVLVCITCRPAGASRELPAAGQTLLDHVQALQGGGACPGLQVRGIACMSGCSRACTVALQAAGKPTYFFGHLVADADTAAQVLACADQHARSAEGALPRSQRPERLRGGILAKLPPFLAAVVA